MEGIQLILAEDRDPRGGTSYYKVGLLNDAPYEVVFNLEFSIAGQRHFVVNGKLEKQGYEFFGKILRDQLNDSPVAEVTCWPWSTAGKGRKMEKTVRVKPKQFFKNIRHEPVLARAIHFFIVFPVQVITETRQENLKSYTKRKAMPSLHKEEETHLPYRRNPAGLANFQPELDLHIDQLVEDPARLSKSEILHIQLEKFDQFIDKAIELGVPRVFIIHGVGKGKLRNEIASRLLQNPGVETFKNEYHAHYGFGATEVVIGR